VNLALVLALPGGRAEALTAGSGTATVTVNLIQQTLGITATFDSATYDLGVNLGPVGTMTAPTVGLDDVNPSTGASFLVPFENPSNSFDAVGDVACPSGGCLAPRSGPYAFAGFLDQVMVSLLPMNLLYTFDGSATCTGTGILTCSGPFVLNAFPPDDFDTGSVVTVDRTVAFRDPALGESRSFNVRVVLNDVTDGGTLTVAGFSRLRGTIPPGYSTNSGGFRAFFFDAAVTGAAFMDGRICVEVDGDHDGIVDGTTLTVPQLAVLHATSGAFAAVPLVFLDGLVCADRVTTFSPFVLLVNTTVPGPTTTTTTVPAATTTTTTTVPAGGSTTTTTVSTPAATTTTLPAGCATARQCLEQLRSQQLCAEPINPKLQKVIDRKITAALTKLGKGAGTSNAKKAARLVGQARAALRAIQTKAGKFVTKKKGPISAECRDSIGRALGPVLGAIDANRF
jgi:hypothetical protein